jgi:transcriptional regulator with XRE-family HTH domain
MASDGTPELAAQRCGAAIARLRTLRNLSRAQLVARLYDEIDPSDQIYERINVIWLARLENGRVVKVARPVVEALCRALHCTPRERAWLLLHADRNVLASDEPKLPSCSPTLLSSCTANRLRFWQHCLDHAERVRWTS